MKNSVNLLPIGLALGSAVLVFAAATSWSQNPQPAATSGRISERLQPIAGGAGGSATTIGGERRYGLAGGALQGSQSDRTIIIPKTEQDEKAQSDIREDISVMAHILEKAVKTPDELNGMAMGIRFRAPFGSAPSPSNYYLEGYGALFLIDVNFPLRPLVAREADEKGTDESPSEWDEARSELANPNGYSPLRTPVLPVGYPGSSAAFEVAKVESLKKNVANALKNATHIRALKAEENIVVVVTGMAAARTPLRARQGAKDPADFASQLVRIQTNAGNAEPASSKLIFRTTKADLEAFQNSKMSVEDFIKEKLSVF